MSENQFGAAPIYHRFFLSKEAEEQFNAADDAVKKTAMAMIEMTCKESMREIEMDYIAQALEDIYNRLEKLERERHDNSI